jgi:putative transposase
VSAVARALCLSRPYLSSHRIPAEPRGEVNVSSKNATVVTRIRDLVARRGSYGYRRVTALLNREAAGPRVNHKRVYRVMRDAGLLLPRYTGRVSRAHDGKVITPLSDMRWCSDSFEIRCWDATASTSPSPSTAAIARGLRGLPSPFTSLAKTCAI